MRLLQSSVEYSRCERKRPVMEPTPDTAPEQFEPVRGSKAKRNVLTREIIGAAIEVHRHLGPGLLESAYQQCLAKELELRGIQYQSEWPLPLEYKGLRVNCGYRVDFLVANSVVIETKAVEAIAPVHEAQLLTYMRLGGWKVGLLINFNVLALRTGIRRKVLALEE